MVEHGCHSDDMPALYPAPHRVSGPVREVDEPSEGRARALLVVAVGPLVSGYALCAAVLAVITALAAGAPFSTLRVLAAAGPAWLAACHIPLHISGRPLGVLPLLLTVAIGTLAARSAVAAAARMRVSSPVEAWPIVGSVAAGHAVLGAAIAAGCISGPVTASIPVAFFGCGVLGGIGAVLGVARRSGMISAAWAHADGVTRLGLLAGALGLVALIAAGSIMYAFALTASIGTAGELFRQIAPGAGSGFGLWLLSLCYLPNALVGGLAFVSGAGLDVGTVRVSPFLFSGGNVPAMPLLAALPDRFAVWWPAVLILPLAAGLLVGVSVRRSSPDPLVRLRVVGVAGLVVAVGCLVLAAVASGALGGGAVTVPAGRLALIGLAWIVVPAAVVAWFAGPSGGGGPVAEAEWPAEFAAEPEPDTRPEPLVADPVADMEPEPDGDSDGDGDGESKGS